MAKGILVFSFILNGNAFFFSNEALIYSSQSTNNCIGLINIFALQVLQGQPIFLQYGNVGSIPPNSQK